MEERYSFFAYLEICFCFSVLYDFNPWLCGSQGFFYELRKVAKAAFLFIPTLLNGKISINSHHVKAGQGKVLTMRNHSAKIMPISEILTDIGEKSSCWVVYGGDWVC